MRLQKAFFSCLAGLAMAALLGCGGDSSALPNNPAPPKEIPPPKFCNGHEALCDRPFNEVALPSTHNSMSNFDEGWGAANQQHGLVKQLEDGIRGMLLDTYEWEGGLHFCHGACELGNTPLVAGLKSIKSFMDEHPHEVLAFIVEDHITPEQTAQAFKESGLLAYVYTHTQGTPWPTLREMLLSQKRLVVSAESGGPPPDWYHHAWDLIWDTPYSFKTVDEFSCALNRGSQDNDLFLLNHWLGNPLPTEKLAAAANAYDVLSARAKQCAQEGGQLPNFVAVDFYSIGDLFQVVNELNGL